MKRAVCILIPILKIMGFFFLFVCFPVFSEYKLFVISIVFLEHLLFHILGNTTINLQEDNLGYLITQKGKDRLTSVNWKFD